MDLNQKIQIHPSMGFHGTEQDDPLALVILTVLVGVWAGRLRNHTRGKLIVPISVSIARSIAIIVARTLVRIATVIVVRTLIRIATIIVVRTLIRIATIREAVASRTIPTSINGFQFN
jgi:hypothetical protein